QEDWMAKAASQIVLPHFKQAKKPFILMFWSRDPDFSQHNSRDSLGNYEPGINGPSAKAGVHNADTMLGALLDALKAQGLDKTTDVFVTADHGFTTISHESKAGTLPNAFLAADLAAEFKLPQHRPGILGEDAAHPDMVVAPNGGFDLIYLPGADAKDRVENIVSFLLGQDYVSGVFVN